MWIEDALVAPVVSDSRSLGASEDVVLTAAQAWTLGADSKITSSSDLDVVVLGLAPLGRLETAHKRTDFGSHFGYVIA